MFVEYKKLTHLISDWCILNGKTPPLFAAENVEKMGPEFYNNACTGLGCHGRKLDATDVGAPATRRRFFWFYRVTKETWEAQRERLLDAQSYKGFDVTNPSLKFRAGSYGFLQPWARGGNGHQSKMECNVVSARDLALNGCWSG